MTWPALTRATAPLVLAVMALSCSDRNVSDSGSGGGDGSGSDVGDDGDGDADGDGPDSSGDGDGPDSSGDGDGSGGDDDAGDTGTMPACPPDPNVECDGPVVEECDETSCGPLEPVDENGCMRPACYDGCPDGQGCYTPQEWGGCWSSGWFCEDSGGQCVCGGSADCGGSYCVDDEDLPELTSCDAHTDRESCAAAASPTPDGHHECQWFDVSYARDEDGQCGVYQEFGRCVAMDIVGGDGCPGPKVFFRHIGSRFLAVDLGEICGPTPYGWTQCSDGEPLCSCF